MSVSEPPRWRVCVDAGGTFTDLIVVAPDGRRWVHKELSGPDAVERGLEAIFAAMDPQESAWPALDLRMGTTAGTNALLERRGARVAWVTHRGFADMLEIGDQSRPELFSLTPRRPAPLTMDRVEVDGRLDALGRRLTPLDEARTRRDLADARARGCASVAISLLHATRDPRDERDVASWAREAGFEFVTCSHEVAHSRGWLARSETALVDAYLGPVLHEATGRIARRLGARCVIPPKLAFMQSNGHLADPEAFRGRDCVMSGPAGGVIAVAAIAEALGLDAVIGFDMGGTSTDVCRYAGRLERRYESRVAGQRIRTPMLELHTVAAGGGSICESHSGRLTVGPRSAGSRPGPLCYGRPEAEGLTITDLNVHLGRVVESHFPFPLQARRVPAALEALDATLATPLGEAALASGLLDIANEAMASAIRRITVARGHDPRAHALVVFGGAGGQHACAVAERLKIDTVVHPPLGGVLSAWGMGVAERGWHAQRDLGKSRLAGLTPDALDPAWAALEAEVAASGARPDDHASWSLALAYAGSRTTVELELAPSPHEPSMRGRPPRTLPEELRARFESEHELRFGFRRPGHPVELRSAHLYRTRPGHAGTKASHFEAEYSPSVGEAAAAPEAHRQLHSGGHWREAPVWERARLPAGARLNGPALIGDPTGTFVVEPGWWAELQDVAGLGPTLIVRRLAGENASDAWIADEPPPLELEFETPRKATAPDPVELELYLRRFDAIAEEMGAILGRTAHSTNIRDRRDFSCAVFDARGELVANAPHIPVHLGAMSETVRAVALAHPDARPGDVFASNDPAAGGSHLPDITVVTPVFDAAGDRRFFVASRGHHADVGGITPGSMPPFSRTLAEEGVVLRALPLLRAGRWLDADVRAALAAGPYPCRKPDEVLADLRAQVAANRRGEALLHELLRHRPRGEVDDYMGHIQAHAAAEVRARIAARTQGVFHFGDALDDGTEMKLRLELEGSTLTIDLCESGDQHPGNLNAPRAVVVAAVLYVLRTWVGRPIPLNAGCLEAVDLRLRPGSLLDPGPEAAVVAGNVETSQRIVDLLLGGLGLAAASQGTMNNLSFGTDAWGYYETLGGGAGGTHEGPGASAIHTHMTNTRLTDPEELEERFPVRLVRCEIRRGSGGAGRHPGGDGMRREYEFLEAMRVSLISERRSRAPFGLAGGDEGAPGRQRLDGRELDGRFSIDVRAGQRLCIETPGGGGYGPSPEPVDGD